MPGILTLPHPLKCLTINELYAHENTYKFIFLLLNWKLHVAFFIYILIVADALIEIVKYQLWYKKPNHIEIHSKT